MVASMYLCITLRINCRTPKKRATERFFYLLAMSATADFPMGTPEIYFSDKPGLQDLHVEATFGLIISEG